MNTAPAGGVSTGVPLQALVVVSEEHSGCLVSRRVREDVTRDLAGGPVRLTQAANPEDAVAREEFFLCFDSSALGGPPGRLALRLGVDGDRPPAPGWLELSAARAGRRESGAVVELTVSVRGIPRAGLYFARDCEEAVERFSCPEAGIFEPSTGRFLRVQALEEDLALERGAPGTLRVEIPQSLLEEARLVERGLALLVELERAFAAPGAAPRTWDLADLRPERLREVVESFGRGGGLRHDVAVRVHRGEGAQTVRVGEADFLPQVRQRIGARVAGGELRGGEVLIRTEPAE